MEDSGLIATQIQCYRLYQISLPLVNRCCLKNRSPNLSKENFYFVLYLHSIDKQRSPQLLFKLQIFDV